MLKKIFGFLLLVIVVLASVVLINTFRFSKAIPGKPALAEEPISDSAVQHLSKAVQIKTISFADTIPADTAEFLRFRGFLEYAYPLIHRRLQRQIFNHFSYLFKWEGKNKNLAPYVLMAHMDVVPVEEITAGKWSVTPFSGTIKDSMVWGRGSVDDKSCVISILEAVEDLLQKNFQPERTIYLSFGHDEEISGTRGATSIASWFTQQNIHPEMVLDEGGEITLENFPELKRPVAVIGIAEKGYLSFTLSVDKKGGHSSMPEKETAIDILSKALVKLREKPMPFNITNPSKELLNRIGPGMPFMNRMALSNLWLFESLFEKQADKKNTTFASFHTTIVPTVFNSGIKDNVIPTNATAIINCRSLPGDSQDDVMAFIKKQINDDRVIIKPQKLNNNASAITPVDGAPFKKIEELCYQTMPDVIPVPYLVIGATDSRHFSEVCSNILRFTPAVDLKGFHGIDERLPISDFKRMIFFYSLLIRESGNETVAKVAEGLSGK
ncbi:MAG TPA: M20 family peptidase [Puia sp.]|nr:M20 family peptidase [Puia sp.]